MFSFRVFTFSYSPSGLTQEKRGEENPTMPNQSQVGFSLGSGFGIPTYLLLGREYWIRMHFFKETMRVVQTSVYCFGFLSNIPILWIFSKEGFASTSNINYFSLGGADLLVCIFVIVNNLFWWSRRLCKYYTNCNVVWDIWTV